MCIVSVQGARGVTVVARRGGMDGVSRREAAGNDGAVRNTVRCGSGFWRRAPALLGPAVVQAEEDPAAGTAQGPARGSRPLSRM